LSTRSRHRFLYNWNDVHREGVVDIRENNKTTLIVWQRAELLRLYQNVRHDLSRDGRLVLANHRDDLQQIVLVAP